MRCTVILGRIIRKADLKHIIHPFLFAAFPVLFLFSHNINEIQARDLVLPLIAVTIGTAILLLLSKAITKNYIEAGIVTSFFLFFFFAYGPIGDLTYSLVAKIVSSPSLLSTFLWAPIFIAGCLFIMRFRRDYSVLTKLLNIFATILIIITLGSIGISQFKTINLGHKDASKEDNSLGLSNPDNPPDIYYIILDTYTSEDSLMKYMGYDNSKFTSYLTSKGFYVATKSRCNYGWSQGSLASALNMNYLDAEELKDRVSLEEIIGNSKVSRLLKSVGYRYIYVDGGVCWKNMDRYADDICSSTEVLGIEFSDLAYNLCETTLLDPILRVLSGVGGRIMLTQYSANRILYAFDVLAAIPDIKEPTFTYAHIMCPHPPANFNSEGPINLVKFGEDEEFHPKGYLNNLIFITKKAEVLVDEILLKSDTPPIIILQGDHGIWWGSKEERCLILNAYHLLGKDNELLYKTISPVNSFRVIFNLYFGTDYELLEDRR